MSYDARCYDLAETFLSDEPLTPQQITRNADGLAQAIQNAIESWIEELREQSNG